MNKYTKILIGSVVIFVFVLVLVLTTKNSKVDEQVNNNNMEKNIPSVKVDVGGENVDVDSLVSDLEKTDTLLVEPTVDDSDILKDLNNTNNYEIQ